MLNAHKIKAVALCLIDTYANQFIDKSQTLQTIPNLFQMGNLNGCGEVKYPIVITKAPLKTMFNIKVPENKSQLLLSSTATAFLRSKSPI